MEHLFIRKTVRTRSGKTTGGRIYTKSKLVYGYSEWVN
jgi:hypothetical protein